MDQLTGQPRELQQPFRITALQLADDVQHITAGTEGSPGPGDYHHAHIFFISQARK